MKENNMSYNQESDCGNYYESPQEKSLRKLDNYFKNTSKEQIIIDFDKVVKQYDPQPTYLNLKQIMTMFWWSLITPYKVLEMKYWEEKGMRDLSAFNHVKKLTRKEYENR